MGSTVIGQFLYRVFIHVYLQMVYVLCVRNETTFFYIHILNDTKTARRRICPSIWLKQGTFIWHFVRKFVKCLCKLRHIVSNNLTFAFLLVAAIAIIHSFQFFPSRPIIKNNKIGSKTKLKN